MEFCLLCVCDNVQTRGEDEEKGVANGARAMRKFRWVHQGDTIQYSIKSFHYTDSIANVYKCIYI